VLKWHEFYAFAGGAAATLMGLMFVVMSLGQRTLATEEGSQAMRALFTPIVVFFATVIVVAMLMLIPDPVPRLLGVLLGAIAFGAGTSSALTICCGMSCCRTSATLRSASQRQRSGRGRLSDWTSSPPRCCCSY